MMSEYASHVSRWHFAVRPLTPTITGATEVQELQNVTLTCSSASQINIPSSLTYTWYGVSGSAISSSSTGTYSIYLVPYAASGSYSCEVTYDTATSIRSAAYFLRGMLLYLLIYLFIWGHYILRFSWLW